MFNNVKEERIPKVLRVIFDSCFGWVVNQGGMKALFTDLIVCSLNVGASESYRRPCFQLTTLFHCLIFQIWRNFKLD